MTPPRRIGGYALAALLAASLPLLAQTAPTLTDLEAAAAAGSASVDEQLELGERYAAAGRYYEALQVAEAVRASGAENPRAARLEESAREGLTALQREKLRAAEEAAAAPGASDETRLALANAYYSAGRYLSAARAYASLPDALRTSEVRLRHARALSWGGRMWEAEPLYAALLRSDPSPELELEYGRLLSWMGASDASRERLVRAYEATRSHEAMIALANAVAWSGNRDEAIELLREHERRQGESPEIDRLLASLTESPDLRLERVERMIDAEPYNLALQLERARLLVDAGRYGQALTAIRDIEERRGDGARFEGLAELKNEANEGRKRELAALRERRAALGGREAETPEQILELAKAYVGAGGHDEAIELYERYLATNPDDVDARIAYARVLTWDRRYDRAQEAYERLLAEYPERADLRLEYAKALSWDAEYGEAVREFEGLTDLSGHPRAHLYTDVPQEAHFQLGQIYRWFGWRDHAIEQQNAALALDATYGPARRELDMARGLRPATRLDGRYTHVENSTDFQADMVDIRGDHWLSASTAVEGWVGRHTFDHAGDSISANVLGIGGRRRVDDRLTAYARLGLTAYEGDLDTRPFWTIGAEHRPSLQSRVAGEYARYDLIYDAFTLQSLETPASPGDAIYIDDLRGHWDHDTGGRWIFLADASHGFVSDDNNRTALHGLATFRLWREPFVALKADGRYLSYDFRSNRYWSPDDYKSLAGVIQIGDNYRDKFFWNIEAKYGRSWENDRERDLRSIGGRITIPISDALDLVASYIDGKSGDLDYLLPGDEFVSYWQRTWYVGVSLKRLFRGEDGRGRDPYYWDDRPLAGSPVVPPVQETF
jgi:tetratricopeptide (TPR) repeat protein